MSKEMSDLSTQCLNQIPSQSVLKALPYGVMVLIIDGTAIFVNDKFTELTGYAAEEIVGLSFSDIIDLLIDTKDTNKNVVREIFAQVCNGVCFSSIVTFSHKNGYLIPLEVHLYKQKDYDTNSLMFVCNIQYDRIIQKIWSLVNSSLDLKNILQSTTSIVMECLGLSSSAILLLDRETQELRLVACNVFTQEDLDKVVYKIGQGPPGIIAEQRKPLYIANLHEDELSDEFVRVRHNPKSSIGYPLLYKDELLGVIAFDANTVRPFSEHEKALFQIIADDVALAIYNAQIVAKLELLSVSDGLTGLYNHRYFQERLVEETNIAAMNENNLSLLFIDIDYFKSFNDSFGHPQGDEVLKIIASLIKANVRAEDIVCRYGGEEFSVILKGCHKNRAIITANRIRIACENYGFFVNELLQKKGITVSIGVASYPEAKTNKELILAADKALYKAKINRNCVQC
jgi:diguanylate cyclase (GGDEF)-like protein/PAS domain S-box-containing protein